MVSVLGSALAKVFSCPLCVPLIDVLRPVARPRESRVLGCTPTREGKIMKYLYSIQRLTGLVGCRRLGLRQAIPMSSRTPLNFPAHRRAHLNSLSTRYFEVRSSRATSRRAHGTQPRPSHGYVQVICAASDLRPSKNISGWKFMRLSQTYTKVARSAHLMNRHDFRVS
jgi:hypothetical protein